MANYVEPVDFSSTGNYGRTLDRGEDDVYTKGEFIKYCEEGGFVDYDGYGHPVKNRKSDPEIYIKPSRLKDIPSDATHIVWYNK